MLRKNAPARNAMVKECAMKTLPENVIFAQVGTIPATLVMAMVRSPATAAMKPA